MIQLHRKKLKQDGGTNEYEDSSKIYNKSVTRFITFQQYTIFFKFYKCLKCALLPIEHILKSFKMWNLFPDNPVLQIIYSFLI